MKVIRINENQYSNVFLLVEGAQANNEKAARDYLRVVRKLNDEQALKFISTVKHDISNSKLAKSKFMLGVVRIVCEDRVVEEDMIKLNTLLKYIASKAHVNEYDRNLNGLSFDEINQRFSIIMQDNMEGEKAELSKLSYTKRNDYTIVPIKSFEEATKYSGYTSWCVTKDEHMYNRYTYDGIGCFYFCLRDGFESVPAEPGNGKPLDNYGLSMIAVSVTPEGAPNTITCRWNHDNGGNDSVIDAKELSLLLGDSFYNMFPPKYTKEQLRELGYVSKDEVIKCLENGGDPTRVSKTLNYLIRRGDKDFERFYDIAYLVNDGGWIEVDEDEYYDYYNGDGVLIFCIKYGVNFAHVKQNIVYDDMPGLDIWVDDIMPTSVKGVYVIANDTKCNICNIFISNKPILNKWVDKIYYDSVDNVKKGKYIGSDYFTFVVNESNKYCLFGSDGKQKSEWYNYINRCYGYGGYEYPYSVYNNERKRNLLNTDGELKFIEFYDTIVEPGCIKRDEPCLVTDEKKYYILSPDGKRKLSKGFYFIGETRFLYNPHTDNFESIGNRKVYSCKTSSDGRTVYLEYIDGKLIRL